MKIKEAFKKLENYNELAEIANEQKKAFWFADATEKFLEIGKKFNTFDDFRKHIQNEYIDGVVWQILTSNDWNINDELTIKSTDGKEIIFRLCITNE